MNLDLELSKKDLFQLVECVKESDWNCMGGKPDYVTLNKISQNPEQYLQALLSNLEKSEKWDKYSKQFIVTVKNDETFMEPIINKELEVENKELNLVNTDLRELLRSREIQIENLKQELQVKVLEIALLKEEKHNDVDCAIHLFGASLTREQCWEIVKNHNELFELKPKLKEIDEYAEQLRYSQSIISWQLKEILKEKN